MGVRSFAAIGRDADRSMHWQYIYKPSTPSPGSSGYFVDLNQSSGIPKYNPFVGVTKTATALFGGGNAGIYPGAFESGKSKYLLRWQMAQLAASNGAPDVCYLLDYLLFYALVDLDNPSPQGMINIQTLPRYTSGEGVRIILVAASPGLLSVPLTIVYTNSDGVGGRSVTFNTVTASSIGAMATGTGGTGSSQQAVHFWPMVQGDKGVRSIQQITPGAYGGGFVCACLVKPLASLPVFEDAVPSEKTFGVDSMILPEILPEAYLNLMIQRGSSAAGNYQGEMIFFNS